MESVNIFPDAVRLTDINLGESMKTTNEMFENLCSEFKEDTGFTALGKNEPIMENNPQNQRERVIAWQAWFKGRERGLNYVKKELI